MVGIHGILEVAIRHRASDLVLKAGASPVIRVDGKIIITELPVLTPKDMKECALEIMFSAGRDILLQYPDSQELLVDEIKPEDKLKELNEITELDTVFTIPKVARIRANLFLQKGTIAASLRILPPQPSTLDELCLPSSLKTFAKETHGLIIITGQTGSGKTTTLAAILEEINRSRAANIYTIEDPIEYIFQDRQSVIHQREVGSDTRSFYTALKSVLRQTPDVIALGELRDQETIEIALTAAEFGHLVLTTLHANSAASTVDRIVNSVALHKNEQIAQQLANSLICITSQRLVRRASGIGRLPAVEVLTNSPLVKKHLEAGETTELYSCIRDGAHFQMRTMNQALELLYQQKLVSYEEAMQNAGNPTELKQMLRRS